MSARSTGSSTAARWPDPLPSSRTDRLSSRGVLSFRHHSVATNFAQANKGVSRFGIRNDSSNGIGFPHGFEVQAVGTTAAAGFR